MLIAFAVLCTALGLVWLAVRDEPVVTPTSTSTTSTTAPPVTVLVIPGATGPPGVSPTVDRSTTTSSTTPSTTTSTTTTTTQPTPSTVCVLVLCTR